MRRVPLLFVLATTACTSRSTLPGPGAPAEAGAEVGASPAADAGVDVATVLVPDTGAYALVPDTGADAAAVPDVGGDAGAADLPPDVAADAGALLAFDKTAVWLTTIAGCANDAQPLRVRNLGGAPTGTLTVEVGAPFMLASDGCGGKALAAGEWRA